MPACCAPCIRLPKRFATDKGGRTIGNRAIGTMGDCTCHSRTEPRTRMLGLIERWARRKRKARTSPGEELSYSIPSLSFFGSPGIVPVYDVYCNYYVLVQCTDNVQPEIDKIILITERTDVRIPLQCTLRKSLLLANNGPIIIINPLPLSWFRERPANQSSSALVVRPITMAIICGLYYLLIRSWLDLGMPGRRRRIDRLLFLRGIRKDTFFFFAR